MNKNNNKTNSLVDVCSDVMLHWVLCNVYTRVQQIAYASTYVHQVKQVVHTIFFQRTLTDVRVFYSIYQVYNDQISLNRKTGFWLSNARKVL